MLNHYFPQDFKTAGTGGWVPPGAVVAIVLVLALAAVCWLALTAPQRPRLAQLVFLVVAAFLLTTKVWSPQYSLWLVPLLALARPRWRMALIWQATEIAVWIGTLLWLLGGTDPNHALSYEGLTALLLVRDGALLLLIGMIVAEIRRPALDIVRSKSSPDPGAGLFRYAAEDRIFGRRAREAALGSSS